MTTETETVKFGDVIQVHYVGTIADTGEEFDNSYTRETPFQFEVGAGTVIGGFDAAVQGMTVGEKKTIALTPAQAYGQRNPEAFVNFEKANLLLPELIFLGSWNILNNPTDRKIIIAHIKRFLKFIIVK